MASKASPYLIPMDYFFWGVVKDKVFSKKPQNLHEMVGFIHDACQEIDDNKELCKKVCLSVSSRLEQCSLFKDVLKENSLNHFITKRV